MAIYHFSKKIISRGKGSSALAAAAYRSASRLYDQRRDRYHNYSNKLGVVHSEVLLSDGAPNEWSDREKLWNGVEAAEKYKNAHLASEIEFAIPRELLKEDGIALARNFVRNECVERGMIADLNVHWDIGADGLARPHAHVMLTTREVKEDGFGPKNYDWNRVQLLLKWRESWAEHANQRLAELDIDARIDHRSLYRQGIELKPQHKIGTAAAHMAGRGLESERLDAHRKIARANGEKIIANPGIALNAITRNQATFAERDLAMFVHRHSDSKVQFDGVTAAVRGSPNLLVLGKDGRGDARFTSRDIIEAGQRLERATGAMANRNDHAVADRYRDSALARAASRGIFLSPEQRTAYEHVTDANGLGVVVGYAGTGKSAMLSIAREAWEEAGYSVRGLALSGITAQALESGSGIASHTIASLEHQWSHDRDLPTNRDVLVIDGAGLFGARQLERVISEAERHGAKVVLVGDPEQLQATQAGPAFRATAERHGSVEMTQVRRQRENWQRKATHQLAMGRTAEAITSYIESGCVHAGETREQAKGELIDRWDGDRKAAPGASRIILTHTNDEVGALNTAARERLCSSGELGDDVTIHADRGERRIAAGDRVMFLRNERSLGVKNGALGQVESVTPSRMTVTLDGGRSVAFEVTDYADIDHGYAATVHKAQGMTADRVHVLATPGFDHHSAYVAMSRHRESVDLHYGRDDFADQGKLIRALSRVRGKDLVSDYRRFPELGATLQQLPSRTAFADLKITPAPALALEPHATPLESAVGRYACAAADILRMRRANLEELPHQKNAFRDAGKALNEVQPDAARDLRGAFNAEPGLVEQAAGGKTAAAIRAMALEAEVRIDAAHQAVGAAQRADRFVSDWQKRVRQLQALNRGGDYDAINRVRDSMTNMAKALHRDPQLESLLRNRTSELGIGRLASSSLSHQLQDHPAISRGRGLGL